MENKQNLLNPRQEFFQEVFVGTLIYVTILGLFNDYTSIVEANSFSTILFASIVLEILTYAAFKLKGQIIVWLKGRDGKVYQFLRFFFIWLVMFLSKFVFIWVLDLIFGGYISINGFFGILLVVVSVTVVHKLAQKLFYKLG